MVIVTVKDQQYYMDGFLKNNLDFVKERVIEHNNMMVCIVDGRPGSGKSTVAAQAAYYQTDGNMTLDNETFTLEQTNKILPFMKAGDGIVMDESFEQINRRTSRTSANMLFLSALQKMRSKRVLIFVVLPYIYDLDKNIILGLADLLIHCYRKPFGPRGQYSVYDEEGIKKLWLYGRESMSYYDKIVKPNFRGRFTKHFPFNEQEYSKKKDESFDNLVKMHQKSERIKYREQRNLLIRTMVEKGIKPKEIAMRLKMTQEGIYKVVNNEPEEQSI